MKNPLIIFLMAFLATGCAVPLSKKTCTSLQGVSASVMTDRQAGIPKEGALAKLAAFAVGKPDAGHFSEVASRIIELAYNEPLGKTESEKSGILEAFVSSVDNECLSGELAPTYNPAIRVAPAIR